MNFVYKVVITLKAMADHPLHRKARCRAALKFAVSQVAARLVPGDICANLPNGAKLLVSPQMKGAAHFIFPGLCEFEPMSFVMHLLRPDELFVDVGANVGAYTVLAGAVAKARVIAFEPSPSTFVKLEQNIRLNGLKAKALNMAVGAKPGRMELTEGLGTENYIAKSGANGKTTPVEITTLDRELTAENPVLMKVDVEGFETEVFQGGGKTLQKASLQAMIVERNESGRRYGFNEQELHARIRAQGFVPCAYEPLSRQLEQIEPEASGNILYVRNLAGCSERLKSAPAYEFGGAKI